MGDHAFHEYGLGRHIPSFLFLEGARLTLLSAKRGGHRPISCQSIPRVSYFSIIWHTIVLQQNATYRLAGRSSTYIHSSLLVFKINSVINTFYKNEHIVSSHKQWNAFPHT
eukprot:GHVR01070123.1.p1 GENE.GHVR01070123.1~~GHVR01070123.1.p1  ORF type:complete len:111 (-),score=0.94 GHVR01070123.1:166-498(-)